MPFLEICRNGEFLLLCFLFPQLLRKVNLLAFICCLVFENLHIFSLKQEEEGIHMVQVVQERHLCLQDRDCWLSLAMASFGVTLQLFLRINWSPPPINVKTIRSLIGLDNDSTEQIKIILAWFPFSLRRAEQPLVPTYCFPSGWELKSPLKKGRGRS